MVRSLWEILVPAMENVSKKKIGEDSTWPRWRDISLERHKQWDAKVCEIADGLTVFKATKGYWVTGGETLQEPMIPVRIHCSKEQIWEIALMTKKFYEQEKVMLYRVSDEVRFV